MPWFRARCRRRWATPPQVVQGFAAGVPEIRGFDPFAQGSSGLRGRPFRLSIPVWSAFLGGEDQMELISMGSEYLGTLPFAPGAQTRRHKQLRRGARKALGGWTVGEGGHEQGSVRSGR